ncbi:MAG: 2-isopropylmalate synthase [Angelakisella sp.]|jgi:2-isopropylmalate synthase|nr:2-isopropylmalate synthase [Angelakisella sp.]
MRKICIFDTTLRDGEQAPGCTMNPGEKLALAKQLERLGVDVIEAGFPVASPDDFAAVNEIAKIITGSAVAALCRAVAKDVETAAKALAPAKNPRLHVFIATSDLHLREKLGITREKALEMIAESVALACTLCRDVEFSAEDATRSDREFLLAALNTAIDAGAATVNVPDTVGYTTPEEMGDLIAWLKKNLHRKKDGAEVTLSVHCHNDLGMAVANSLAAIRAGASQVEGTINGIGERAGNVALEEVIMALDTRGPLYQAETGIDLKQIYRTCRLVSTVIGQKIPPNKPVVGRNAFNHEAGIHQHGVLKNPLTYEIMSPERIGIYDNDLVLGKHSGKHAFTQRVEELGYILPGELLEKAFARFLALADRKKTVTNKDIEAIVGAAGYSIPETYKLHSFVVNSGTVISATAVVKLIRDGEEIEHVARGDGPIDAAFKAIDRIVKVGFQLVNYSIHSVTEGEDAQGEVVVKLRQGNNTVTGRGLSTDIFEASLKAYLNAVNKIIAQ